MYAALGSPVFLNCRASISPAVDSVRWSSMDPFILGFPGSVFHPSSVPLQVYLGLLFSSSFLPWISSFTLSSCGLSQRALEGAPFSINIDDLWMTLVFVVKDVNNMGVMGLLLCLHPLSFVSALKGGLLYPRLASN